MLRFNQPVQSTAFGTHAIQIGWHEAELAGIWSRDDHATLTFPLEDKVSERGGVLMIECVGAVDDQPGQWIEIDIEGLGSRQVMITDKSIHLLCFALPANCGSSLRLRLKASRLVRVAGPGGDRALGGLLKSVRVAPRRIDASSSSAAAGLSGDGVCHVPLSGKPGHGLRIRASQAGRLLVPSDEGTVWTACEQDGVFEVPAAIATAAKSVIFLARDLGTLQPKLAIASGVAHPAFSHQSIPTFRGSELEQVRIVGKSYSQAVAVLPHAAGSGSVRILVSCERGAFSWRVRPSYGASWTWSADAGLAGDDVRGPFRAGLIAEGEWWRLVAQADHGPPRQLAAALVGACIAGLDGGLDARAGSFARQLLRRILTDPEVKT